MGRRARGRVDRPCRPGQRRPDGRRLGPGPGAGKVRALYPVEFPRYGSITEASGYGSREPCRLDFTRDYDEAPFLWLDDSDETNQRAWRRFFAGSDDAAKKAEGGGSSADSGTGGGMFGCLPVRRSKPAAKVYARLVDPKADEGGAPIFMAGQFYGCGRVFYLGSGEMWRLRAVSEGYFDRFYTRLVRHVAQERLLRQSKRGSLTVDKEQYVLGSTVEIRAQLTNAQAQPLAAEKVSIQAVRPDGSIQPLVLSADVDRPGIFAGQFTVLQEGAYRLQLPLPESAEPPISRRLQVIMPNLEQETLQRNEPLLRQLADGLKDIQGRKLCEGKYYDSLAAAFGPTTAAAPPPTDPLLAHLHGEPRTLTIEEGLDQLWERTWLGWLIGAVCGLPLYRMAHPATVETGVDA